MTVIRLVLPTPTLTWHDWLKKALEAAGHHVSIETGRSDRIAIAAMLQLRAEKALGRCNQALIPTALVTDPLFKAGSLRICIDGSYSDQGALTPTYDGLPGLQHLIDAICKGRAPLIDVKRGPDIVAEGRPALRNAFVLSTSLDDVLHRLIMLLVSVMRGDKLVVRSATPSPTTHRFLQHSTGMLARTSMRTIRKQIVPSKEHWRVGIRRDDGSSPCSILPDDGQRYYADPFWISRAGKDYIFVEDYPYDTNRGVISVVERTASGFSAPMIALERPFHLSYPFIYEVGDDVFMIPETGSVRRVERYRAERFPDRWVLDKVLIDDLAIVDVTLIEHEGRHWMFGTLAEQGWSSWDCLMLFYADHLDGPWQPHAANPVLIDAGCARPAGRMWHDEEGGLRRVAQDCRGGYGKGVVTLRVDELTPTTYRQSLIGEVDAPVGRKIVGFHTRNPLADGELIDFCELRRS